MDEFANELLHSEIFLNVTLPRIPKRNVKKQCLKNNIY